MKRSTEQGPPLGGSDVLDNKVPVKRMCIDVDMPLSDKLQARMLYEVKGGTRRIIRCRQECDGVYLISYTEGGRIVRGSSQVGFGKPDSFSFMYAEYRLNRHCLREGQKQLFLHRFYTAAAKFIQNWYRECRFTKSIKLITYDVDVLSASQLLSCFYKAD